MLQRKRPFVSILAVFALLAVLSLNIGAMFPSTSIVAPSAPQIGGGKIGHVIIIVEENERYTNIVGNRAQAPYQNQLISQYASAANYFSPEHPSLPNYIDLTAGSDLGITSDCTPPSNCPVSNTTNISTLLNSSGLSWKEYAESMPQSCYTKDSSDGLYVTKHNPFVYYPDVTTNQTYCNSHVVPMNIATGEGFLSDLNSNNLPNYSFITPNLCDDGHDTCAPLNNQVKQVDNWLQSLVPKIIASPEFSSTALFIVYDEGTTSTTSSQVACILVSPFAKPGYVSTIPYTHFSLLATAENILGLGDLGRNDSSATIMSDMFSSSTTIPTLSSSIAVTSGTFQSSQTTTQNSYQSSTTFTTISPSPSSSITTRSTMALESILITVVLIGVALAVAAIYLVRKRG